ncbi:hypothetical protein [Rhodococcus kronopolitis]|uniref:HNH endonuclease n=1 Tax=Rhodococcus kronopolitis TaxID=1460226 RepID=A0ABV9FUX9_9NOCA
MTDWVKLGQTNIDELGFACDACHALIHDGPGGWRTRIAPADAEHPSRVEWIAPPHIDPEQRPRVNHRHHPAELLARAHAHRCATRHRHPEPAHGGRREGGGGNQTDGDVP